jgi:hypothetical protein
METSEQQRTTTPPPPEAVELIRAFDACAHDLPVETNEAIVQTTYQLHVVADELVIAEQRVEWLKYARVNTLEQAYALLPPRG